MTRISRRRTDQETMIVPSLSSVYIPSGRRSELMYWSMDAAYQDRHSYPEPSRLCRRFVFYMNEGCRMSGQVKM
jgi:hypothetical protein